MCLGLFVEVITANYPEKKLRTLFRGASIIKPDTKAGRKEKICQK